MSAEGMIREVRAANGSTQDLKTQLARYVAQQPESKQVFHRRMKAMETVGIAIIVAAFVTAMYVSIHLGNLPPAAIPVAWFVWAASAAPAMLLVGLHAVALRAFPPIAVAGKSQPFVTGSKAVALGWGLALVALVVATFWGAFSWAVWTNNMALISIFIQFLAKLVAYGMTIAIVVSIAAALWRQTMRLR